MVPWTLLRAVWLHERLLLDIQARVGIDPRFWNGHAMDGDPVPFRAGAQGLRGRPAVLVP